MIRLGLAMPATFLVAKPTPRFRKRKQKSQAYISFQVFVKVRAMCVCSSLSTCSNRKKIPVASFRPHLRGSVDNHTMKPSKENWYALCTM